jgi:ATP-dependent DNA helicase RecG
METEELLRIIANGEDSRHQFKANVTRSESIAQELIAFNNSDGGLLIIGVTDDNEISGLTNSDVASINQLIGNAATNNVRPSMNVTTENISLPDGKVIIVQVEKGLTPRGDNQGNLWVKNGSDKRKVTVIEELQRMFQAASLIHADGIAVQGTSIANVDEGYFSELFMKVTGDELANQDLSRSQLLQNMNLMKDGMLNTCGTLLLAQSPQFILPSFIVKVVAFPGEEITDQNYIDSQDITGKLSDIFQQALNFVLRNIIHQQGEQGFNSLGEPEIPRIVFEELIANALIHRDYFTSAPVRILVFSNRVEIISPGHLPNNLTVENIRLGNSNSRNPILASFANHVLPYRGIGSGIRRALKVYPDIELKDNRQGNLFEAIIARPINTVEA